ncbi:MAG: carbonate dehydratase, partial [Nitrobacter vulgaris]|nr:carbonate dehydratase [Nitrobacter vulgaris]
MQERTPGLADSVPATSSAASPGAERRIEMDRAWHALDSTESLELLGTRIDGLGASEAAQRLAIWGPNLLPRGRRRGVLVRFVLQFH